MQLILNGDTRPIVFAMVSSTDHITGLTGASPTVTLSKNGGAFAAPAGTVAEIGNGWYKLTPSGADVTTNGAFILHATASGADPADIERQVVAFSPYDSVHLGLSALPSAAAGASGGLPLADSLGDVTLDAAFTTTLIGNIAAAILATPAHLLATDSSGRVTVAGYASGEDPGTLTWNAATASFDASGSFGAFVQAISGGGGSGFSLDSTLSGHDTAGTVGYALTNMLTPPPSASAIATAVFTTAMTESYSTAGGVKTLAQGIYEIAGILSNIGQSGTTLTAYKLDTVTPAMTFTLSNANAPTAKSRAS